VPSDSASASSSVRIRRPDEGDVAALVALENEAFVSDRISARQWRRHFASPRAEIFVATRQGRAIGAAMVLFRSGQDAARLYSIAVTRSARGTGVGEALLAAAERAARRRHARAIRLEVRRDSPATIRFYEKRGYLPLGIKAGFYEDGCDAFHLEKPLSRAETTGPRAAAHRRAKPRHTGS
jgi:[ribosomal protein S18]-alanine N-acetyltransferase